MTSPAPRAQPLDAWALRRRAFRLLEFDGVREALASYAAMPLSRELARGLEPAFDEDAVRERQEETAEALLVVNEAGDVSVSMERDVRPLVDRAAVQAVLTGDELDAIAVALEATRRAKAIGTRLAGRTPHLRELSRSVPDLRPLEREIRTKVTGTGELADNATPYLRELRREGRDSYRRANEALQRIVDADAEQGLLQEHLITLRAERLVVPLKAEFRARLPGIIHGVSDSGATLFVEPFQTVGATNVWRERQAQEREEAERILRLLSAAVARRTAEISYALELTARIDLSLARARYGKALGAGKARLVSEGVELVDGRHPLIGGSAVPVSLRLRAPATGVVITGPNTGGKTVALKTLGLMVLMHQSGLMLPCDESTELPVVDGVYVDIGDQQSIAAAVSSFSAHLTNIADILRLATDRSLVLLDELGTSTDPDEGSALARAILAHLAERGVPTVATTHHRAVAAFAEAQPGLQNASVELDPVTLTPTYRVTMGLPGRSYALEVAQRLGLNASVLAAARALQDPDQRAAESLLASIQEERHATRRRLEEAAASERHSSALRLELEQRLENLALAQDGIVEDTRSEMQSLTREILARLKRAEAVAAWEAVREPPPPREVEEARDDVAQVQRMLRSRIWGRAKAPPRRRPLAAGDTVEIGPLGITGRVITEPSLSRRVEVLVGSARIHMDTARLKRVDGDDAEVPTPRISIQLRADRPAMALEPEVDVRGMRVNEAAQRVDAFLDDALADGREHAIIIHGKGTGALRQGLWKHLASHGAVASYDYAEPGSGGDGATIVQLV